MNMTQAIDNAKNSRQLYMSICMNVQKHLQYVKHNNDIMMCTRDKELWRLNKQFREFQY